MTELAWTAIRTETIDRFHGQTPRPEDETLIIDVFEIHPQLVLHAIDETAAALNANKITWAWSVLKARLERGTTAIREATADTSTSRQKRITSAKQWIRNAGVHHDLERHVEAELFGDEVSSGRLQDYTDDTRLRTELLEHWRTLRPLGIKAQQDHDAWNERCRTDRLRLQQLLTRKQPNPDPDADIDFDQEPDMTTSSPSGTITSESNP